MYAFAENNPIGSRHELQIGSCWKNDPERKALVFYFEIEN